MPAPIGPVPTRSAPIGPVLHRPAADPGTAEGGAQRRWRAGAALTGEAAVLAMLAVGKLALHLATAARYGYHRDELHYLAAGRHLTFGYPDFPPVSPALARLAELAFGGSLVGLRLVPAVAGAAIVVLAGLFARELGGGRAAVVLAGLAALVCPMLIGANLMLQTVTFDQLAWMTCLYLLARLLRTGDRWLWIPLGAAFGIGLETKYTILVLGFGIAVGVLATPVRRQLRTPWPWLAGAIAAASFTPNLAWQAAHGWPTLEFLRHHDADMAAENSPLRFAAENLLLIGVLVEAGAIDRFGGPLGLPAAASGHNGYWFWLPHTPAGGTVIAVGYDPARLAPYCTQVGQVATLDNADHVRNEEHGKPVSLCRHTRVPVRDWPFVHHVG